MGRVIYRLLVGAIIAGIGLYRFFGFHDVFSATVLGIAGAVFIVAGIFNLRSLKDEGGGDA